MGHDGHNSLRWVLVPVPMPAMTLVRPPQLPMAMHASAHRVSEQLADLLPYQESRPKVSSDIDAARQSMHPANISAQPCRSPCLMRSHMAGGLCQSCLACWPSCRKNRSSNCSACVCYCQCWVLRWGCLLVCILAAAAGLAQPAAWCPADTPHAPVKWRSIASAAEQRAAPFLAAPCAGG